MRVSLLHDEVGGLMKNKSTLLDADSHFKFGKNWLDYSEKIDEERIENAISDLKRLSGLQNLSGKTFLDIGCGSGLHSLAAIRMGAERVVGVDIDEDSVFAAQNTLRRFAPNADAAFLVKSVFDMTEKDFGGYDIVYSWGVLHHTGDMYRALAAAAALVKKDGQFLVALYRKTWLCGLWKIIKKWYSAASGDKQERARKVYIFIHKKIAGKSYKDYVENYKKMRGMEYKNDVHDWIGGYPYESISKEECIEYFSALGFEAKIVFALSGARRTGVLGSGCDEYSFQRM